MNQPTVMIIPAYEPPLSFLPFLRELREATEAQLVIVDDGSGDAYRERFAEAERIIYGRKIYAGKLDPSCFLSDDIEKHYNNECE